MKGDWSRQLSAQSKSNKLNFALCAPKLLPCALSDMCEDAGGQLAQPMPRKNSCRKGLVSNKPNADLARRTQIGSLRNNDALRAKNCPELEWALGVLEI